MTKDADDFSAHSFFVPQSLVFPLNGARNCESETRKGRGRGNRVAIPISLPTLFHIQKSSSITPE